MSFKKKSQVRRGGEKSQSSFLRNLFGWGANDHQLPGHQRKRHLVIDPLEERQMFTLTPIDGTYLGQLSEQLATDIPANLISTDGTRANQSLAADSKGDYVVAWAQQDGADYNIYAKYYTDETQRITLPPEALTNNTSDNAKFSLVYGGNEIQQITFSSATTGLIFSGQYTLSYTASNGTTYTTGAIAFNVAFPAANITAMQTALRALGTTNNIAALQDVVVAESQNDPLNYLIYFGDNSNGAAQNQITVSSSNFVHSVAPTVTSTVGNISQTLSIASTSATAIKGTFVLMYNGNSTATITFDETATAATNAASIQTALRDLGTKNNIAVLQNVVVSTTGGSTRDFVLTYGSAAISLISATQATWTAGVTPTVDTGTVGTLTQTLNLTVPSLGVLDGTFRLLVGTTETADIVYDESLTGVENAAAIQAALQALSVSGATNFTVTYNSARRFTITFDVAPSGTASPQITYSPNSAIFTQTLVASAKGSTLRDAGMEIGGSASAPTIQVSATNAYDTATAIETAMKLTLVSQIDAPIVNEQYPITNASGSAEMPVTDLTNLYRTTSYLDVKVVPVLGLKDANGNSLDGRVFDITFINNSGTIDHPELKFGSIIDEKGISILGDETLANVTAVASGSRVITVTLDPTSTSLVTIGSSTFTAGVSPTITAASTGSITQTLTLSPSAAEAIKGTFTLTYGAYTTAAVAFDDANTSAQNAAAIQSTLRALGASSNIDALKNVVVTALGAHSFSLKYSVTLNGVAASQIGIGTVSSFTETGSMSIVASTVQDGAAFNEVQQIVLTPSASGSYSGTFKLSFNGHETAAIAYDSSATSATNAAAIQAALRATGISQNVVLLQDVTVLASGSGTFLIQFGDNSAQSNVPQITVDSTSLSFSRSFTPTLTATTGSILQTLTLASTSSGTAIKGSFTLNYGSTTTSTITFDETATAATNAAAVQTALRYVGNRSSIRTIKQNSDIFRVNPEEVNNPYTAGDDKYDQINPSVAMDGDGNFVIVWESVVPDSVTPNSGSDIFARRFAPVGVVASGSESFYADMDYDGVAETAIQGVRAVAAPTSSYLTKIDAYTFRVNELTTGEQTMPSVAMDEAGNFVVAWQTAGQEASFYNDIRARQFSHDGAPMYNPESGNTSEWQVNATDTQRHIEVYVAKSKDGHFVVTWDDEFTIEAEMYDALGNVLVQQFTVNSADASELPNAAYDYNNNCIFGWTQTDTNNGVRNTNVYMKEYDVNGAQIRGATRMNSLDTTNNGASYWPGSQMYGQAGIDADGDLMMLYQGYGPDVAVANGNPSSSQSLDNLYSSGLGTFTAVQCDIDSWITYLLARAQKQGSSRDSISGIAVDGSSVTTLNEGYQKLLAYYSSLRGEANGILFSAIDAATGMTTGIITQTDSVANDLRDGQNARCLIALDSSSTQGSLHINVDTTMDITVGVVYYPNNGGININATRSAIDSAISNVIGDTAWNNAGTTDGSVSVRVVSASELNIRSGTYWDYGYNPSRYVVYEVTFQGSSHDTNHTVTINANSDMKNAGGSPTSPAASQLATADAGTAQTNPSLVMLPDGSFIAAWTQIVNGSSTQVVTRTFQESTDTVGPRISDIYTTDTSTIDSDMQIYAGANGLTYIVLAFDEDMMTTGRDSVTNVANYKLLKAGVVQSGAIVKAEYGLNMLYENSAYYGVTGALPSNKYEVILTLDSNLSTAGYQGLTDGHYELQALAPVGATAANAAGTSGLRDRAGNALNSSGYSPNGSNYSRLFYVSTAADNAGNTKYGDEYRVNNTGNNSSTVNYTQTTGVTYTDPTNEDVAARTENTKAVAMDHSGDYVVVWTSYAQDGDQGGVYMRMYDRNDKAILATDTLVNVTTAGNQRNASVAMDADGDFVVVWECQNSAGTWDIYARRFNSVGKAFGSEFLVNTITNYNQINPSVAINSQGNFVITWATQGQSYSYYNDIHAQIYDYEGNRVGGEFRVNTQNIPGATGSEINPVVAMDDNGNIVVVWEQIMSQNQGITTSTQIVAQRYNFAGVAQGGQFRVDSTAGYLTDTTDLDRLSPDPYSNPVSRKPSISMDSAGNFVVVWESFLDNDVDTDINDESRDGDDFADSWGIYFRQFHADGTAVTTDNVHANMVRTGDNVYFGGDQTNGAIAMDADGDIAVVWDGNGSTMNSWTGEVSATDPNGIFVRTIYSLDEAVIGNRTAVYTTAESRVNSTSNGVQQMPSIAMTPDGDYIVIWSGVGVGDSSGIFARRYTSNVDNAGPMLTDFLLPDGTRVSPDNQVTTPLTTLKITFDEELLQDDSVGSVFNKSNFKLMNNGVAIEGGIVGITFGLDATTNKWTATITIDANGATAGVLPITNGQWQLVVLNTLCDKAGNKLQSSGYNTPGQVMSKIINVAIATATAETQVSPGTVVDPNVAINPVSGQSVAGDADGDHVVVWQNNVAGAKGILAKLYTTTWTTDVNGNRTSTAAPFKTLYVTSNSTATNASVARDADGDFVVTWEQQDAGDWNVYACRFDAAGNALNTVINGKTYTAFRVNSVTADVQRNAAVALDADGDFVVTWQSMNQDGSGYGIYAQRFSPAGVPIGGTNDVQYITFVDGWTGSFSLLVDDDNDNNASTAPKSTAKISNTNLAAAAVALQSELSKLGLTATVSAETGKLRVTFEGVSGSMDQAILRIDTANSTMTSGTATSRIEIATSQDGSRGEFRVNDTTASNQIDPAIAMDSEGNFVISWTSFGQDGDGAFESNIYAKKYAGNYAFANPTVTQLSSTNLSALSQLGANDQVAPLMTTVDNPDNHIVSADSGKSGVVQIIMSVANGTIYGSGVLLAGTNWILTAAHVADYATLNNTQIRFDTASGTVYSYVSQVVVNPGWLGSADDVANLANGNDIALIQLAGNAPAGVEGYQIYRGSDEIGQVFDIYGYGTKGTGAAGTTTLDGDKRTGENQFDATGIFSWVTRDTYLAYDFDDGTTAHDAFGQLYGINDLGLGVDEVNGAPGDSGGPLFINGKIAGISSFSYTTFSSVDATLGRDCSYGEFSGATRVSLFADWIDTITQFSGSEFLVNANTVSGQTVVTNNVSGNQKWSSVAMDADGDFVISWTSYGHDGVGNGYATGQNGIFARRFNSTANNALSYAASDSFRVNNFQDGNQQYSSVAMDADGDFVVAWESFQDRSASSAQDVPDSFGIYARKYVKTSSVGYSLNASGLLVGTNSLYGTNGEVGGEIVVNTTLTGNQTSPSVTMDQAGDFIVVWFNNSASSQQVVSERRYDASSDVTGPIVGDVLDVTSSSSGTTYTQIQDGAVLVNGTSSFVITLGEEVSNAGGVYGVNSITNVNNWELLSDGVAVPGGVQKVLYGYNSSTKKFEITITFATTSTATGVTGLGAGNYTLRLKANVVDLAGNKLDGNFDGTSGGEYTFSFSVLTDGSSVNPVVPPTITDPATPAVPFTPIVVNTTQAGDQFESAIATDPNGNYVIVWTSNANGNYDVMGQRFDRYGKRLGTEFIVSSANLVTGAYGQTAVYSQYQPDIAMDDYGNFVVTWTGYNFATGSSEIYARVYSATGMATTDEFIVNQYVQSTQSESSVAMDSDGDFVVSWTSYGQDSDKDCVVARRFKLDGTAYGNEFIVNTTTKNRQDASDIAISKDGSFVIVWESDQQDGSSLGVYAQRFNASGAKIGSEFRVNSVTTDKQVTPKVAMDSNGDFIVVWSSFGQDGSGYGIYAKRYNASGVALDGSDVLVNQTTLNYQTEPDVSCDDNGNYIVVWTTPEKPWGENNGSILTIKARMFKANGTSFVNSSGTAVGEFSVANSELFDQFAPAVAMDADGDAIIAWTSADGYSATTGEFTYDVFSRIIGVNKSSYAYTGASASSTISNNTNNNTTTGNGGSATATGPATFKFNDVVVSGSTATISWTCGNLSSSKTYAVSLYYDKDGVLNGNEVYFSRDSITASSGTMTYSWDFSALGVGTYTIGGYIWDLSAKSAVFAKASTTVSVAAPSFAFNSVAVTGTTAAISWTCGNLSSGKTYAVSLYYDKDGVLNGNEVYFSRDKIAANGVASYSWDFSALGAGTYTIGGYMWDTSAKTAAFAKAASKVTVAAPSFAFNSVAVTGTTAAISWTCGNLSSGKTYAVSLYYDKDGVLNGNEVYFSRDKIAANGVASYSWDFSALGAGTYTIGGYLWDDSAKSANFAKAATKVTVAAAAAPSFAFNSVAVTGTTAAISWTCGNLSSGKTYAVSLYYDKDGVLNGNEVYFSRDKIAANGVASYSWDFSALGAGTYTIGGYLWDDSAKSANFAKAATKVTVAAPSFAFNSVAVTGTTAAISWTCGNLSSGKTYAVSLYYDKDGVLNGNEVYFSRDKIAANGVASYSWDFSALGAGTYTIGGYLWDDSAKSANFAKAATKVTVAAPSFAFNSVAVTGTTAAISWTCGNLSSSKTYAVSLYYDKDGVLNGNEVYFSRDKIAANGVASYSWDFSALGAGTYTIGGYLWDDSAKSANFAKAATPVKVAAASAAAKASASDSVFASYSAAEEEEKLLLAMA